MNTTVRNKIDWPDYIVRRLRYLELVGRKATLSNLCSGIAYDAPPEATLKKLIEDGTLAVTNKIYWLRKKS